MSCFEEKGVRGNSVNGMDCINFYGVFGSDIGGPTDDLVRLSIPIDTNKPPTRSVDDILSKLIPPLHKPEGTG
ncbi:uncharacterized protein HKW66_Vig0064720 [Vigna angularis]|uniref:Uncharacterized protein n=1 Tax=Phaseolus angularis TaxID=3914 RepID=A0A8T0KBG6_PHAAN|nr:uncharacterized protein HKW66_Vig0064720 [Vigna angularis]